MALGRAAAAALPRLDRAFVLRLCGDLGAGKTTFARGLLAGLGHAGPVRSPSYGLVADYAAGGRGILHLDLYRLQHPDELGQLGLRDWDLPEAIWLVEWPEKGRGAATARRCDAGLRDRGLRAHRRRRGRNAGRRALPGCGLPKR